MPAFDLFIGVDWSGARGPRLPGFQVALLDAHTDVLQLVENPEGGHWRRSDFVAWLQGLLDGDRTLLCGMDFSFCLPWVDRQAWLPGIELEGNHQNVWVLLDDHGGDKEFGVNAFVISEPWSDYFASMDHVGANYERRLRVTEQACMEQGLGTPESLFNLRGARQVGKSSLTGMRILHALKHVNPELVIWPFDDVTPGRSTLVETFPTAFVRMAGGGAGKVRDVGRLQDVLVSLGCLQAALPDQVNDNQADALITAAGLRYGAANSDLWHPVGLSDRVRRKEGWSFGVR